MRKSRIVSLYITVSVVSVFSLSCVGESMSSTGGQVQPLDFVDVDVISR